MAARFKQPIYSSVSIMSERNEDIPSNLGHVSSGYESNWPNMLTSQSTLAASQLTSVMSVREFI